MGLGAFIAAGGGEDIAAGPAVRVAVVGLPRAVARGVGNRRPRESVRIIELVPRVYDCEFSIGVFFFFFFLVAASLGDARSRATATEIILLNIGFILRACIEAGAAASARHHPLGHGACHSVHLWLTASAEQRVGTEAPHRRQTSYLRLDHAYGRRLALSEVRGADAP